MQNTPLITHVYTADPSAHVFNDRLYLYPSHDRDTGIPANDNGDQYDMDDYHVFSLDTVGGAVTDHGVALALSDIPWASRQLWAPDAAYAHGTYYLFFPARDQAGLFRIGVATSPHPHGPFTPEAAPIPGSFSIDPCCFTDDDGEAYLYFGGIWGGQLQGWETDAYDPTVGEPTGDTPALSPRVARLTPDRRTFAEPVTRVTLLAPDGQPLRADDHDRRFFEAAWVHKYNGTYYFSYSTGDTHYLVYATSDNPLGPFTYQGRILEPVIGWTTHHSIAEFQGQWYLFYHDASLSGGQSHLRCVKVAPLTHDTSGHILPITP